MEITRDMLVPLYAEKKDLFDRFSNELQIANDLFNITAIKAEDFVEKHVLDSLSLLPVLRDKFGEKLHAITMADIGAGGGFPSVPLLLCDQNLSIDGIESNIKKSQFLLSMKEKFGLARFTVCNKNVKEVKKEYAVLFFRAFSSLDEFFPRALSVLGRRATIYALKGKRSVVEAEISIVKKTPIWKYIQDITMIPVLGFPWERNIVELTWGK